jgi:ABC-type hemin transport system substrate-binding protein
MHTEYAGRVRVVSLVPSLTELVRVIAPETLAGRTRFCTEPADVLLTPALGGPKDPDVAGIGTLAPDLVIANREENRREDVEALKLAGIDVMVTDPVTIEDAMAMVMEIAIRVGNEDEGWRICRETSEALKEPVTGEPLPVFVAVWPEPLIGLGSATFGHHVLERCGGKNVLAGQERYPAVTMDEVAGLAPSLILLPDEPYPFTEAHRARFEAIAPARVIDGKLLWWYGARMASNIRQLREILREERH